MIPIVDNLLEQNLANITAKKHGESRTAVKEELRREAHRAVTLAPMQVMPSHPEPHGSPDWPQLGGVFCQADFRDWSTAAGPIQCYKQRDMRMLSLISQPHALLAMDVQIL